MRKLLILLCIAVLLSGSLITVQAADDAGGVQPATMEKYQKARDQVDKLSGSKAEKLAPEAVEDARKNLAIAQDGLKTGNDKATREAVEMTLLKATLAALLADEREATEKSQAVQKELSGVEARLSAILTGKGDGK